ncbi:hypothetical protein OS493_023948 [Desmophyllum pertusum]|uniref:Cubilin n=1 Tax=Desmophyllum pertusum TaxID=174260 RepID=A0A9W9YAT9_9CNID|nr:hypothetical protein OS493_023948 [Desmophyllum pertusum]
MIFNWIYAKFTISTILLTFYGLNEATGQGCKFTLTQDSGRFQTPNFPGKYPNDVECIWNIQVQPGRFVLLSFDVFELESFKRSCIDLIEVKDGSRSTDQLLGSFCDIDPPPKVITSSTNNLRIWFYSDKSVAYRGFNASYTSQWEKGCGGSLTKHSGSISSPRYPDYLYPNSMQCDWSITMPRGKFVRLQFSDDFEVEFNCDGRCWCADRLELWDGPEFNETKLGSFCVSVQPLIVSKTNRMRLRFTTNREGRFRGFQLSYTTSITPSCGGDFMEENGIIVSPNYPMSFPAFSDCVWRIKAPTDHYISFRFLEFTGINGTNSDCSADSIEVREGYSGKAELIERYCIQNIPPVIVSSGHELYIHFRARSDIKATLHIYRRFRGFYMTHSTECNETVGLQDGRVKNSQLSASSYYTLQLGQGQLYLSPQYGRVGNAYSWCSQTQVLNMIVGEYLQIDLLNLTEVTAIATQASIVKYRSMFPLLYPFMSRQSHVTISTLLWPLRLSTSGTSYMGFVSRYKVEYTYGENRWIPYMDDTGNSSSLGYTEFSGNTNSNGIKKNILKPSIMAKIIRIFPTGYQSYPVKHMCLKTELYGCRHDLGCGTTVSFDKPGKISVRGSDQQSKKCTWLSIPRASSSSNDVITFHFTYFDVPCHHGHVILHARNGGKMKTLCGADPPQVSSLPASSQIRLAIKLEKGSDVWGFDLKYNIESLGCGRIIQVSNNGIVKSPNYPSSYDNNQDCTWILSSDPGSKIEMKFIEFDLQPANQTQCDDFVQIQDGRQDMSDVLGKFCGNSVPIQVTSTFNHLRVTFHSDNTTIAKGFLLEYSLASSKKLESPSSRRGQSGQTENTEATAPTAEIENSNGQSTVVTACLINISLLTVLTKLIL